MAKTLALTAAAAALILASCSSGAGGDGNPSVAVPRRVAYPRMELPTPLYDTITAAGHNLIFNSSATVETRQVSNGNVWLTVTYPTLGDSQLMVTAVDASPDEIPPVLDNRAERINLNLSGNPGEVFDIDDTRLSGQIIVSRSIATPVQFLATDNSSIVISGALYMPQLTSATRDSLAPAVDYIFNDVVAMLENLSRR